MNLEPVAVSEIAYEPDVAKLLVRLSSGERFVYVGVPGEVHRSFLDAPSRDSFFQAEIHGRYPYNQLDS